jgi:hypothetical protein
MNVAVEPLACSVRAFTSSSGDVAELLLLLPADQAVHLEWAARRRGLTVGQMLRRAVQALLHADGDGPPGAFQQSTRCPDTPFP